MAQCRTAALLCLLCLLCGLSLQIQTKSGNFAEDGQWMKKPKQWDRFRDQEVEDDFVKTTGEEVAPDEMDTTKDPCRSVKCSRHKVCVAQGLQRAVCVHRKKVEPGVRQESPHGRCRACPVSSAPVCGSDGHNYASECKLQQQACLTGKDLNILCSGFCPCTSTTTDSQPKQVSCSPEELADLGDRLRDWFQLLHGNNKRNDSSRDERTTTTTTALDRSVEMSCRDSITWMFSRLDSDLDQSLERSELESINLDQYEVCVGPFFSSCDSDRDGAVSRAEWCLCFWRRDKPPCVAELERIQVQEKSSSRLWVPSCDEQGDFRRLQCDLGRAQCWCVDPQGSELTGTRTQGTPDCDEVAGHSGDSGSGVGWEDEEETKEDRREEEEEEEEEEESEAEDGGYIW